MMRRIEKAIALSAGFGTRLRPMTDRVPKAMVRVHHKPLLDYTLDYLRNAGVSDVVVNTHYLAPVIHDHVKDRAGITLSHEPEILETGGGIQNILPHFENRPFFAINADSLWVERGLPVLDQLSAAWDEQRMDALLLLLPNDGSWPELTGDFFMDNRGLLRRAEGQAMPFIFIGVQILHPRLFAGEKAGKYSLLSLYNKAAMQGRLYGHVAQNIDWFHISTPEDWQKTEAYFNKQS